MYLYSDGICKWLKLPRVKRCPVGGKKKALIALFRLNALSSCGRFPLAVWSYVFPRKHQSQAIHGYNGIGGVVGRRKH